jgi:neutral amino acid transport system ATP-binding protein
VSSLLEVREVTRTFGGVRAVDAVSFDVVEGSITALIGPNGAGKSSLFNIISGFLRPERGTVHFSGHAIERRRPHRIAQAGLVRTFQTPRALTKMSVLENVLLAGAYAGTLSGGERKLLDFARVLMTKPRLILLDEPMAGVNPTLAAQLLEHMLAVREESGVTFLLVEHDLDLVMRACDTVVVMNEGRILMTGTPDDVRRDERVIDAYLGTHA